jgi:hypothetical protein
MTSTLLYHVEKRPALYVYIKPPVSMPLNPPKYPNTENAINVLLRNIYTAFFPQHHASPNHP